VELALTLPLVVVLLLLVVQAGLLVTDQVAVVQGARDAARRAAVDRDAGAARRAALQGRLDPGRTDVQVEEVPGDPPLVRATVVLRAATDVPIVGPLLPDVALRATTAMVSEAGPAP
jgi:hypothetical protein